MSEGLTITVGLRELSARLTDAAAIVKGAVACAEGGSEREALQIAMDVDELLHEPRRCTAPSASGPMQRRAEPRAGG